MTDGVPLGVWVGKQRMKYRRGQLSPERVASLEKAGISWETRNDHGRTPSRY
ncbi:helicase associated domain-containing protein [Arthrobacter alpinus]|uniref:helicase associated domain-containing protein n=1 Tax=Arthrobacter alpinus TaxID=656366 RepID=UPI00147FBA98